MNRFILRNAYPVTFVILAILAWFIYRQFIVVHSPLFPFVLIVAVVWAAGAFVFIYFWPSITNSGFKRAALQRGFGGGPIPINTLYAVPFKTSPQAAGSGLLATGAEDLLYVVGVMDLAQGPRVLHVPDFAGRYYCLQMLNPKDSVDFAYVGKRATGTQAGEYLISGPGWQGMVPPEMKHISAPNNTVLVVGRALVQNDSDIPNVYALTSQIELMPYSAG